jgi:hypothetical protein
MPLGSASFHSSRHSRQHLAAPATSTPLLPSKMPAPAGTKCMMLVTIPMLEGMAEQALELFKTHPMGRGLHSSTFQLNFSRVSHKKTPYIP